MMGKQAIFRFCRKKAHGPSSLDIGTFIDPFEYTGTAISNTWLNARKLFESKGFKQFILKYLFNVII